MAGENNNQRRGRMFLWKPWGPLCLEIRELGVARLKEEPQAETVCVECGTRMRSHAERRADGQLIVKVLARCATCREDLDVISASRKLDRLDRSPSPPRPARAHLHLVKR